MDLEPLEYAFGRTTYSTNQNCEIEESLGVKIRPLLFSGIALERKCMRTVDSERAPIRVPVERAVVERDFKPSRILSREPTRPRELKRRHPAFMLAR